MQISALISFLFFLFFSGVINIISMKQSSLSRKRNSFWIFFFLHLQIIELSALPSFIHLNCKVRKTHFCCHNCNRKCSNIECVLATAKSGEMQISISCRNWEKKCLNIRCVLAISLLTFPGMVYQLAKFHVLSLINSISANGQKNGRTNGLTDSPCYRDAKKHVKKNNPIQQ